MCSAEREGGEGEGRGEKRRGAKMLETYRQTYRQTYGQTYRHTDRPSDEAGPRGAFAPKKMYEPHSTVYFFSRNNSSYVQWLTLQDLRMYSQPPIVVERRPRETHFLVLSTLPSFVASGSPLAIYLSLVNKVTTIKKCEK